MANWYPIIVDPVSDRLKELPAGDTLDLSGASFQADTATIDTIKMEVGALAKKVTSTTDIDLSAGTFHTVSLNSSRSITISNPDSSTGYMQSFLVEVDAAVGSYAISWPGTVNWDGGVAPSFPSGQKTLLSFYTTDNGTSYNANAVQTI